MKPLSWNEIKDRTLKFTIVRTKMNIPKLLIFTIAILLLVLSSRAEAQYAWTMTNADTVSSYYNAYTALSCHGDNCTAVGTKYKVRYEVVLFWRSNDGGITWKVQDPGMVFTGNAFTGIQQIDSLNVVAIADSGLILRTFDGGATWEKQNCNTMHTLYDVHFSDPLTGIVVSTGPIPIHTTTDGGKHWTDAPFADNITDLTFFKNCYSYGNGKFRAFRNIRGPIYTTTDNWHTIDSTKQLVDTVNDPEASCYNFYHCNFTGGDTMIAYGLYYYYCKDPLALIIRSTDAGKTWSKTFDYFGPIGTVDAMSRADRDTILAGGFGKRDYLLSTDNGITWSNQNLPVPNTTYEPDVCISIDWASNGHPVAAFKGDNYPVEASIIIRGDRITDHVDSYENIVWNTYIYPNPATTEINITTPDISRPVHIYDILGREVMRNMTSTEGKVKLDITNVMPGIYSVVLDHDGKMLSIGKVVVYRK
jgi:photosystem II stability/assembly factor-like uncharacterized protein